MVFFIGGVYEYAINDSNIWYYQSQLVFILDLPKQDVVNNFNTILLQITPTSTNYIEFDRNNFPVRTELIESK